MATAVPIQTSFNSGIFGSRMGGRSDQVRYQFACEDLQNFSVTVQGPAVKRSGTRFVRSGISINQKARLIPFQASVVQSYMLELGVGTIRFYRNGGAVIEPTFNTTVAPTTANPVLIDLPGHPFNNGESVRVANCGMTELDQRFFTVANVTGTTFELSGEDGTGRTTAPFGEVARHYSLRNAFLGDDIPWAEADLDAIQFIQNGDLMYLVHKDYPPHEIIRISDTNWTCKEFVPTVVPLETENVTSTEMSIDNPLVGTGRVITASVAAFTSADIGRDIAIGEVIEAKNGKYEISKNANSIVRGGNWISGATVYFEGRVYAATSTNSGNTGLSPPVHEEGTENDGVTNGDLTFLNFGYGLATITGFTDSTHVIVTVTTPFPKSVITGSGASVKWSFGAWDAVNGYPRSAGFYEDRLWFGGTLKEPQTFWGSKSGVFTDFRLQPPDVASTGVQFTILSETLDGIEWMLGEDSLILGTTGGEYAADSGTATEAITPSNIRVRRRSRYGSTAGVQPRSLDSSLVFVRSLSELDELTFDFDTDRHVAIDLTQFAHDVLRPGIREIHHQGRPFRQVWASKTDGTAAAMTFVKSEDVVGWSDMVLGGTDTFIESLAVIPHPDGEEDQVWFAVRRTINGNTVRHIELLEKRFRETDLLEDAFFVDTGLTYSGPAVTVLTGLWHLEGETVHVLSEGARLPDQIVSQGTITISPATTKAHVGLAMATSRLRTVRWNSSSSSLQSGTSQALLGRVSRLNIRVAELGDGLEYGGDFETMDPWERRLPSDPMDAPVPLFTGDSPSFDMPSGWDRDRRIAIRHDEPTPCTILAFIGKVNVEVP